MADNTTLNLGSGGDLLATDDIGGGVKIQRVKRSLGRDGTASDAATPVRFVSASAANQDSTVIKASAGVLYGLFITNTNGAARYVKIYNKATGPTSADTPLLTICVPGDAAGAGIALPFDAGADFSTGISLRATTGVADNDANAVAANEIIASILYV